jgi:transposase
VRIALTSGLSRLQVADDLWVGFSTLNKCVSAHRDTDVLSAEGRDLARENERLRREVRILKEERDILKKATQFFASQKPRGSGSSRKSAGRVIGWAVSDRMKRDLAIRALNMAIALRFPPRGCVFQSDRGSQYRSHDYERMLREHGLQSSMSGKGNCYDCEYGIAA